MLILCVFLQIINKIEEKTKTFIDIVFLVKKIWKHDSTRRIYLTDFQFNHSRNLIYLNFIVFPAMKPQ